jgi:Astacin (Peptidase family M12A)
MARARSTRAGGGGSGKDDGELRSSPDFRTALIPGNTFAAKAVRYAVVDDLALFEGDIVLGTVEQVEQQTQELRDVLSGELAAAVVITGAQFRWLSCRIPYTIDPGLPTQQRVTDAIAHWESHTRFRFVLRTAANTASFPDWVTFRSGSGCSSAVGRRGGQQFVNLGSECSTGNVIHEIGHVVGLWHEQSREDRDSWVTIHWNKIQPGLEHNFDQHIADGDDVGSYDYGSIMHYPRNAFSSDGTDTITPIVAGATIGQRTALSAGDIAAANSFCPIKIKEQIKDTFKDIRKDPLKDGRLDTFKEQVKDVRFDTRKELIRDTIKEQIKDVIKDRKEPIFDPRKAPFERPQLPQPGPRFGIQPGEALPFAVAAPHQAPAAGGGEQPEELEQSIAELDAQLQMLAEQIAQFDGDRATLQAQYDELSHALEQALAEHEAASQ